MFRVPPALLALPLCLAAAASIGDTEPEPERRHEDAAIAPLPWALPAAGSCQPMGGLRGWPPGQDAPRISFQPGDRIEQKQMELIRDFLPPFIWENRERFFYEGMRMVIGACFADYGAPDFFQSATANFAGQPRLTEEGGIADYTAGLPFPLDRLPADDPQVGPKWAWNAELRYQAAGFRGRFRTADMVGHFGRAEPFVGEIFKTQQAFRADRVDDDYTAPGAKHKHWVAGGELFEPFDARHYAWRQYRDVDHLTEASRSDDLHAYLPDYRRVRRVPATGTEGLYMPSFSVGVSKPQSLGAAGSGMEGVGGAIGSIAGTPEAITTKRSGFEGLEMRPLLYDLRLLGVQDVLTPINASTPGYPTDEDREFGPWGLSFASDRWDLRRAVVIEGNRKSDRGGEQINRFVQYFDIQTLAPLYYASWDGKEQPIDVGMFVGRWSEERPDYPRWPDDPARAIRVIDPVGASFANLSEDGGWRRESWELISTPPDARTLRRMLSVSTLTRQR
jgi:hypothetical protein